MSGPKISTSILVVGLFGFIGSVPVSATPIKPTLPVEELTIRQCAHLRGRIKIGRSFLCRSMVVCVLPNGSPRCVKDR